MAKKNSKTKRPLRSSPAFYFTLAIFAAALVAFILFAHPFLAVTKRVDADILVVEGWIPDYMLPPSAHEFQQGNYSLFLVSGLLNSPQAEQAKMIPEPIHTASRLQELGIPSANVLACPATYASWRRTSKMAQAIREKIAQLGLKPKGINVITAGPHARETWVAYQHVFGEQMPVGIISIPKNNYPADRWWLSQQGLIWVPKDFIAWLKEVVLDLGSGHAGANTP